MKKFLLLIGGFFITLLLTAYALDFAYTFVYSKSTGRNKIENVINSEAKTYDVIMLGSSRANNHFDPKLFQDKGYKAFNYGMSGSHLQESALLLQLMMDKKYKIKNIILEVDLNINSEGYSEGTRALLMPYILKNKTIFDYYKDIIPDFKSLVYIPFYRYLEFDSEIGFREMYFSAIKKPARSMQYLGFHALQGQGKNMNYDLTTYIPKKNKYYELIKEICKKNDVKLIVVSTPMCKNVKGIDYFAKVQKIYPEVLNYENTVVEDKYFSSCGHLNKEGANLLTLKIMDDLFINPKL